MDEQSPLSYRMAGAAEARCVASTVRLLLRRKVRLSPAYVGTRLNFADGTSACVYRETLIEGREPATPCVLIVRFRLRLVRSGLHTLFRWESLLNTPLFVGFPGFVNKLWLAHDEEDIYRGVYDWDGADRAEYYARSLWRVLALGCEPPSISFRILPGLRRDDILADPHVIDVTAADAVGAWWRPVSVA